MKTRLLLIFTLLITLAGCTHNNGDIGSWFGTWHIESITNPDGNDAAYNGSAFMQFQSTVVCLRAVDGLHNERADYGRWEEVDNTLTITLPDPNVAYDRVLQTLPGGPEFSAEQTAFHFTITARTTTTLSLQIPDAAGKQWTLFLKKQ